MSIGMLYDEVCYTMSIGMLYDEYRYVILLVYLCCTLGTRVLHLFGTVFSICLQAMFSSS